MAALSVFLDGERLRREWSIEEFAKRAGISTSLGYQILRDGKDNVRQDTLAGIAAALGMTAAELLRAAEAQRADDAVIKVMWQQVPTIRTMLQGIPDVYHETVIAKVFGLALENARELVALMAKMPEPPVSAPPKPRISAPTKTQKTEQSGPDHPLSLCKPSVFALAY